MDLQLIIEIIGSLLTIGGAWLMSHADDKNLVRAFILFSFSNCLYISISLNHGLFFLLIQMLFFYTTAIKGVYSKSENKREGLKILGIILSIQTIVLIFLLKDFTFDFSKEETINYLELTASIIAISGSFLLTMKNVNKVYGFIGFLVADILYIKVGYDNAMIPFMLQSAFFVYTSLRGIKNSKIENAMLKEEKAYV